MKINETNFKKCVTYEKEFMKEILLNDFFLVLVCKNFFYTFSIHRKACEEKGALGYSELLNS